jgi:hypothetical protein
MIKRFLEYSEYKSYKEISIDDVRSKHTINYDEVIKERIISLYRLLFKDLGLQEDSTNNNSISLLSINTDSIGIDIYNCVDEWFIVSVLHFSYTRVEGNVLAGEQKYYLCDQYAGLKEFLEKVALIDKTDKDWLKL